MVNSGFHRAQTNNDGNMMVILVGGLEHDFYDLPYIGNVIIPID
jgi:hypothetical protein